MNYRRGLHRLYLVLAASWFLLVLFMVATDHWFWTPWRVLPVTWEQLAKKHGLTVSDVPAPPPGFEVSRPDALDDMLSGMPKAAPSPLRILRDVAALSVPLPALGYLLFFWVWPWIYRGFRPTAPAG
jgi:hypothetical protein